MTDHITYRDLDKALKYARIYGLANERQDILDQCGAIRKEAGKGAPGGEAALGEECGRMLGEMFPYALASVGSAGGGADADVCRIVREHASLMDPFDRASAIAVAGMMKDGQKGGECPFHKLCSSLELEIEKKEEGGAGQ
ncbi:MAG: hypothetical protein NC489_46990 [Ruminococcus flavefaciens]|nr:hypothetical protein [Ruminococcus flavefaciens]